MPKDPNELRPWTGKDSAELYGLPAWGADLFSIDEAGDVTLAPSGRPGLSASLPRLVRDLQARGFELPLLLRLSDVLEQRVDELWGAFESAIAEFEYQGGYRGVYPIKVNQQRHVVEELVRHGRMRRLGLEAGSKPELLIALAYADTPGSLIVCNGYKDAKYIETALLAQRLGRYPILVLDRFAELDAVMRVAERLGIRPHLGVRAKLSARGAGKWIESGGDRSKFGLNASELVRVIRRLEEAGMLDCLELLHFHIGSQITAIRSIKAALKEATRIYVELYQLGAGLRFLDVGGGLGVDYDGSKSNFHSSTNYSLTEYARDVVYAVYEACKERDIPHPDLVSESGRALVAHSSVLVFDVLGTSQLELHEPPKEAAEHEQQVVRSLYDTWVGITSKNFLEAFHDAQQLKEEAQSLFKLGYLDLEGRALCETIFWAIADRVRRITRRLEHVPEDLDGLPRAMADTYYCNFSVFQSAPDHWAVKQLFPVMPLHRLNEEPRRRATLADLTCDSDGKVDEFIDLRDVKKVLELHELRPGEPYYLGMFLVGAYQEILGDLHNLFGDTTAIHVRLDEHHGYRIDQVVEGDPVERVIGYVQYDRRELVRRVRVVAEAALRDGSLPIDEFAQLLRHYEEGLSGYTYLSRDEVTPASVALPAAAAPLTSGLHPNASPGAASR